MTLTSGALAVLVSAWLVPPYLALVAWILVPTGDRRGDAAAPAGRAEAQAESEPRAAEVFQHDGIADDAGDAALAEPPAESDATIAAESLADPAGSGESPALKTKRGRSRSRKAKATVETPPSVTWVQVGPGKYVRVEGPSPAVAPSSQAPEAGVPAEAAGVPDLPTADVEERPEATPPGPIPEAAPAAEEVLAARHEEPEPRVDAEVEVQTEAHAEAGADVEAETPPVADEPAPAPEEALPPSVPGPVEAPEAVDAEADAEALVVAEARAETEAEAGAEAESEAEAPGSHLDEPHEVDCVAESVPESGVAPVAEPEGDILLPADRADDAGPFGGEESEKLGIAPEASDPEPADEPEPVLPEEPAEEEDPLDDVEPAPAPHDPPARPADRTLVATFRSAWSPHGPATWSVPDAPPSRRNVRSGRAAPGFRQRSRRSAGRIRQPCRAYPPRAPPRGPRRSRRDVSRLVRGTSLFLLYGIS